MNKFILRYIGLLTLSFFLIFSSACTNGNKKEKTNAKEEQTIELTISAAASLQDAFKEIEKQYKQKEPNIKLSFNFGGSGALQQQIEQGAPADLFFSAAEDKFQTLVKKGFINKKEGKDLLGNELVLVVPKESSIQTFQELKKEKVKKLAIGTPESVPAGKYAKALLTHENLWNDLQDKIVPTKDVRQVLTYVETGNVDAGIVYKTDALISDKVKIATAAPANSHEPIRYPVGIIKESKHKKEATLFYEYLQSKDAQTIFNKYGFTILP
ncbi:molybdate ABC transporter substrate-binding protein [Bacillus cytotoxicus]|uniref:Molybdenum ABC transporter, molybdenum-binding protein n=1 Tax=Bacillus cytotoxicus TaxID=580165 RepID=A0AAX2CC92_9BACI|nr:MULTISPECIES: molybdate ABC transporter substrate-binding protein [Bacillus cereus group]AWC27202.1 molybdate ABC transporter substrate-binding protein [Bacillus cytotoxicus]AWC31240.1 molybdate ABC transporter substrate-binding protein [Bacillus cytotoxicus]AWC35280.1 molybdate ABC transporter substrate-binding protein [Bacillus cytotoxicus]AWC39315.1 molybdate ABC transporter substrate-binding protein [Bacillus cytotoxicus]AWC47246.1 molybdate ABC transporter substrate-binding protein [Ba